MQKTAAANLTSCSVNCDMPNSRMRFCSALSLNMQPVGRAEHIRGSALMTAAHRRVRLTADSARPVLHNLNINAQSYRQLCTETEVRNSRV